MSLTKLETKEVYYALEALYYNAYMTAPPKGKTNAQLITALAADKVHGYELKDIIAYVWPKS